MSDQDANSWGIRHPQKSPQHREDDSNAGSCSGSADLPSDVPIDSSAATLERLRLASEESSSCSSPSSWAMPSSSSSACRWRMAAEEGLDRAPAEDENADSGRDLCAAPCRSCCQARSAADAPKSLLAVRAIPPGLHADAGRQGWGFCGCNTVSASSERDRVVANRRVPSLKLYCAKDKAVRLRRESWEMATRPPCKLATGHHAAQAASMKISGQ
jgi:hypothetical protein